MKPSNHLHNFISNRLKTPIGILHCLLCLTLSVLLYCNWQLFFCAQNDENGNWKYIFFFLCLAVLFLFIRYPRSRSNDDIHRLRFGEIIYFAAIVGALWYYTLEVINNYTFLTYTFYTIEGKYVAAGILIAALVFIGLLLMTNSLNKACITGSIFYFIWALAEHYTHEVRGLPVQFCDLFDIPTAATVAGNYEYPITCEIITMLICLIFLCSNMYMSGKHVISDHRRSATITRLSGIFFLLFLVIGLCKGSAFNFLDFYIDGNIPAATFRRYGIELSFIESIRESVIDKPEDYSIDELLSLTKNYSYTTEVTASDTPNIVVIMNETFADVDLLNNAGLSEPVLPNYTGLNDNIIKGKVLVSTIGGGTGKSEYEFLTGNSMHLYPTISPYVRMGNKLHYSIPHFLSSQGYSTYAIHPQAASNYNRKITYETMGFDQYYSGEYFDGAERYGSYVSDAACYNMIFDIVENTDAPAFVFCVTMQNHSPFTITDDESTVSLQGISDPDAERYLTMINESDRQIDTLLEYFEKSPEKSLVLFFGDHFPSLSSEFWEYITGMSSDEQDYETKQLYYATPFFIWANYPLDDANTSDMMISTNYLGEYMLELAGCRLTAYQQYLHDLRSEIPAFSAFTYYGSDQQFHEYGSDPEVDNKIRLYDCLQYAEIFDNSALTDFFDIN